MYLCVTWQLFTDDPVIRDQIGHDIDHAFGTMPRAKIVTRTVVLRPAKQSEIDVLLQELAAVEAVHGSDIGLAVFFHTDGDPFYGSDPFDVAAARAVTKAEPIP
jgi:hypothetical protein